MIFVLNGPNLGRLGVREPDVYGALSLNDLAESCSAWVGERAEVVVRQTDDEAELIGWLHEAVDVGADVVLNPAAFTHFSYAVRDAAAMVTKVGFVWLRCIFRTRMRVRSFVTIRWWGRWRRGLLLVWV